MEEFDGEPYKQPRYDTKSPNIPNIITQCSEDIPDIIIQEMRKAFSEMENNKTPGEDEIKIEAIKTGGNRLHHILKALFNIYLLAGTTPSQWHKAIITEINKKGDTTELENYRLLI